MRYFDHNATHPLSAAARESWLDAVDRFPANPSSPHRWGARASAAVEEAREQLGGWLGCRPQDLVWTSGATEANNAILHHLGTATHGTVLISAVEHPSVWSPARRWLDGRTETIPVRVSGVVDLDWIDARVRRGGVTAMVVMAANNETGVIQPWRALQELCHASEIRFVCDAAQWLGRLPAEGLGASDLLTASAHKFGGPQGVGVMKCPVGFRPLLVGGLQEEGRRAGTVNVAGILSMVAALEERGARVASPSGDSAEALPVRASWRDQFVEALKDAVPGVRVLGESVPRLWNTVAVIMPEAGDCRRRWVARLDKLGFAVSTGSACSSGREQPSPVLAAMGCRSDESDRMLRISAGWDTSGEDWTALLSAIRQTATEFGVAVDRQ
ncbi:MAG: cysteine desulfurase [Verrucomicrobiales bacterium]|nr:cysteine desulfurase [Verrucomicrobiales bacterium]